MRRAERLFEIIQILRLKKLTRARDLAEKLEVSERTIYRDIAALIGSGVPIEGEAGVGYLMRDGFDLPPLMFDEREIEALALGARVVETWTDPEMAAAAANAIAKIEAPPGLYKMSLLGPAPSVDLTGVVDYTAPRFTATDASAVEAGFTYTATVDEASIHRIRYRKPAYTGEWVTGAWNEEYETSISDSQGSLDQGTYEIQIQAQDAAENSSVWWAVEVLFIPGAPA